MLAVLCFSLTASSSKNTPVTVSIDGSLIVMKSYSVIHNNHLHYKCTVCIGTSVNSTSLFVLQTSPVIRLGVWV